MKYKYIIFDLFGTLVSDSEVMNKGKVLKESLTETESIIYVAHWRDWHRNNYSLEEFMSNIKKTGIYSDHKLELIKARVSLSEFTLFEDTISTLSSIKNKGYSLSLLSNAPPVAKKLFDQEKSLKKLFNKVVWSFEVGCMKPEKVIFDLVVDSLNCKRSECLYIGDGYENDYLGAKNAGINSILIDRQNRFNLSGSIKSLTELLNMI